MSKEKRIPIITEKIDLQYTKGVYNFFCKNIARAVIVVLAILRKLFAAGKESARGNDAENLVKHVWIVNHMKRKLEGICSISSSVHDNCNCARWRKLKDCICKYCYAYNQQAFQTGLREHNILNGFILRNILIPVSAFKKLVLIFPYLRIESFGDVANVVQARNYIRIIKAFPGKRCAIWSKNLAIWKQAFAIEGKPENTTFVYSSPYINVKVSETILDDHPYIDHIFTVFTKAFAKKHNIVINCGGRKCLDCIIKKINCYFRGGPLYINELKK